jgi:hypothetical protein
LGKELFYSFFIMERNERYASKSFYPRRYFPPPSNHGEIVDWIGKSSGSRYDFFADEKYHEEVVEGKGGGWDSGSASGWCLFVDLVFVLKCTVSGVLSSFGLGFGRGIYHYLEGLKGASFGGDLGNLPVLCTCSRKDDDMRILAVVVNMEYHSEVVIVNFFKENCKEVSWVYDTTEGQGKFTTEVVYRLGFGRYR